MTEDLVSCLFQFYVRLHLAPLPTFFEFLLCHFFSVRTKTFLDLIEITYSSLVADSNFRLSGTNVDFTKKWFIIILNFIRIIFLKRLQKHSHLRGFTPISSCKSVKTFKYILFIRMPRFWFATCSNCFYYFSDPFVFLNKKLIENCFRQSEFSSVLDINTKSSCCRKVRYK